MAVNYQQTDTVSPACGAPNRVASVGGTAGTTPVSNSITSSSVGALIGIFELDPGLTSYAAGNYVVRLNITTANMNLTLQGVGLELRDSSCGSISSIGSLTGLAQSLGSTGVLSFTVSGSAKTPASTNIIFVTLTIDNAAMSLQAFSFTPNQIIDTPLANPNATVNLTGQSATASVGTVTPTYNKTVSLTGQSATASVGTVTPAVVVNATVNLTGQSATASVGTVTETYSGQKTLTGQSATASVGTVTRQIDNNPALTGLSATASVGTVTETRSSTATLTGQSMTASVGTVSVTATGGNATVSLSGLTMTASVGSVTITGPGAQAIQYLGGMPDRYAFLNPEHYRQRAEKAVRDTRRLPKAKAKKKVQQAYRVVASIDDADLIAMLAPYTNRLSSQLPDFGRLAEDTEALRRMYLAYYAALEEDDIEILLLAS